MYVLPQNLTTAQRLDEIAALLEKGARRLQKKSECEASGENFTGLHRPPKRSCRKRRKA